MENESILQNLRNVFNILIKDYNLKITRHDPFPCRNQRQALPISSAHGHVKQNQVSMELFFGQTFKTHDDKEFLALLIFPRDGGYIDLMDSASSTLNREFPYTPSGFSQFIRQVKTENERNSILNMLSDLGHVMRMFKDENKISQFLDYQLLCSDPREEAVDENWVAFQIHNLYAKLSSRISTIKNVWKQHSEMSKKLATRRISSTIGLRHLPRHLDSFIHQEQTLPRSSRPRRSRRSRRTLTPVRQNSISR